MPNPEYWGFESETPIHETVVSEETVFSHPDVESSFAEEFAEEVIESFAEDFDDREIVEAPASTVPPSTRFAASRLRELIRGVLRRVLASLDGSDPASAQQLIQRIQSSERVLKVLPEEHRHLVLSVLEVLSHEASVLTSGRLDLRHLPVLEEYESSVAEEIDAVAAAVGSAPVDPHAEWQDLVESVQRAHTRWAALDLATGIESKLPVFELMDRFRKVEPPTAVKSVRRERGARTAREVAEQIRSASAGRTPYRFSSGLPTLDVGYTGVGEERGFIAPGQFSVVMGPTGTGKSSFANSVVPAINMDLKNWGLENALQVVFHTEEESIDKLKGFRMDIGQKYHHLAENLVIDACGTSRRRLAETLYDLVIRADELSRSTKRPISEFLPYVVQIDYIQSIQEPEDKDPATASAITAEFLLRGVCAWNPEEMAKFSGVDFREYAGAAWPSGMENHRVAVIAYAQLVKIDDSTLYYQPERRGVQLSDFALLNERDEPMWEVREGDLRLFGKNQMRGSGIIAQNAHAIVILHRSVPYNNPSVKDAEGELHLTDTRARILFDKSRSGSRMAYAPMRFDVQSTGFRAQYFDEVAEKAIEVGKLTNYHPSFTESGDPILPIRPYRDPFLETRY